MQQQVIYGVRPVIEAIEAGKTIDRVYIEENARGELVTQLRRMLKEQEIPHQILPQYRFFKVADRNKNHQGVVAYAALVEYQEIDEVVQQAFERGETPLVLVLDRITDVRNFGALARTAECMGVHALLIPSKGAAAINEDAIKTSAGALMKIPVCRTHNLKNALEYLHDSGLQLAAATEKGAVNCWQADLKTPLALIMGNEEEGVSPEYLKRCDTLLKVPMTGTIESLNVSVAAGMLLYECARQRGH
ncbi:MAG: 23S rRNA (guanosine(2251)-2'-O)-methyltransferase RlmB [Bacteroidetes bacterium]|nr:MAG: 23S rRNA (guanosine(2251)-2'-O)-methyltransferase RlmB [Bacteroidota bacterium]